MAEIRQKMRGSTAQLNVYTGPAGQLCVDMSRLDIRLFDGIAAGGVRIPNFDFNESTYAKRALNLNTGSGLTGGGNLTGDLTLTVDATVLRTTGNQSKDGQLTLYGTGSAPKLAIGRSDSDVNVNMTFAGATKQLFVGMGSGGDEIRFGSNELMNDLANVGQRFNARTGDVDFKGALVLGTQATGPTQAVRADRILTAGTGLAGGGSLASDRTFSLAGNALSLFNLATNGLIARTAADTVTARTLTQGAGIAVTNGNGVAGNPTVALSQVLSTGSGINGGGNLQDGLTLSVNSTVLRTSGVQTIDQTGVLTLQTVNNISPLRIHRTNNDNSASILFSGLTGGMWFGRQGASMRISTTDDLNATPTHTFNSDGTAVFIGTLTVAPGTLAGHAVRGDRAIATGDGLTGGGNLVADRTLAVASDVARKNINNLFTAAQDALRFAATQGGGVANPAFKITDGADTSGLYFEPTTKQLRLAINSSIRMRLGEDGKPQRGNGDVLATIADVNHAYTTNVSTWTGGSSHTLTHGLGGLPDSMQFYLKCKVAIHGYAVDEHYGPISAQSTADGADHGLSAVMTATQIKLRLAASGLSILNTSGNRVLVNNTNFDLHVRAWKTAS